jgi:hypothetical protein
MTFAVAVNLLALGGVAALVLWRWRRPTEIARVRNALSLQVSRPEDFTWTPPPFPAGFAVDHGPPTREFQEVVANLNVDSIPLDWDKARVLATHLVEHAEDKGPLRDDLLKTYRGIRSGYGYCADFVKVYLGLAYAAGLIARQWGFSFDGFGGHGHTVVEVFDRQRVRWLMLDVFNNFHVVDLNTGEPLGALEYRDSLLGRRPQAVMRPNGPGRPGFVHEDKAIDYYRRGVEEWYLVWGNAVFTYYRNRGVRALGKISTAIAFPMAQMLGLQPHIRIYQTPQNADRVHRLFVFRRWVQVMGSLVALLAAMLVVQLLRR